MVKQAKPAPKRILEFRQAVLPARLTRFHALAATTFTLHAGDLMLVRLQRGRESLPLADAAMGLHGPEKGEVYFQDKRWIDIGYEQQVAQRIKIGRVFDHIGWINNLTMLDNLLLAGQHHKVANDTKLIARANTWATRFGLDEVPATRRAFVAPWQQRVLQWVRAFLLKPDLLILERPGNDVPGTNRQQLLAAVTEFIGQGGAVLWSTDDDDLWHRSLPPATSRFEVRGDQVVPVGGGVL